MFGFFCHAALAVALVAVPDGPMLRSGPNAAQSGVSQPNSAAPDTASLADQSIRSSPHALKLMAGQSQVVLTREAWEGRPVSLADVLAEQAGIETRRYGGVGSFQTISMRGSTGARVTVLLDDVPLNSAGGGPVDLGKLDLGVIERIEAVRGMVPAEDGGNGMGGVVRLYSRGHVRGTGSAQVSLGSGSHGTMRHALAAQTPPSAGPSKLTALVNAAYTGSENDFRYLDRNSTPYNLRDDAWVRRRNSEYAGLTASTLLRFDALGGHIGLKVGHDRHEGGLPGRESEVTTTAGHFLRHTQYLATYARGDEQSPGQWRFSAEAASDEETPGMHWTRGEPIGWPLLGDSVRLYSRSRRDRLSLRAASGPQFSTAYPVRFNLHSSLAREALEPWGDGVRELGWRNGRDEISAAGDAVVTLWRGKVHEKNRESLLQGVVAGHVSQVSEHTEGAHVPLGGSIPLGDAGKRYWAGRLGLHGMLGDWGFYANAGRYYHLPSLSDRFGSRYGVAANPGLVPERALHLEAGLRFAFARGYAEVGWFRHATEDALYYSQVANLIKAYNLDAGLAQGIESQAEWDLLWGFKVFGNVTWQVTRNLSDTDEGGKLLPNQPAYKHAARLSWSSSPGRRYGLTLDYRHEGSDQVYRDPINLTRIPPQTLHHAGAHVRFGGFGAHLALQNLGDAYYEDAYGAYPYPGRQYLLTVTYQLP